MIKLKHHTGLTQERWCKFTSEEQMANAGMEVSRSFRYRKQGDQAGGWAAFERAMELFYLTVEAQRNGQAGRL